MEEQYYVNIHTIAQPAGELRGQLLNDINYFPMDAPAIDMPINGQIISIEGDENQEVTIRWDDTAMDENEVVYIWEAAVDEDFDTIAIQTNVGVENMVSFTYGSLDTLLSNLGVMPGDSATIYHRVLASDGAVQTEGMSSAAVFIRNLNVNSVQSFAEAGQMKIYPSHTATYIQVELRTERPFSESQVIIRDAMGRRVLQDAVSFSGVYHDQIDVSRLASGIYTVSWLSNGQIIQTKRFVKQ